jgi:hypothetical protein
VEAAHRAGLEAGVFFILFYPGEIDDAVLETLRFAAVLIDSPLISRYYTYRNYI